MTYNGRINADDYSGAPYPKLTNQKTQKEHHYLILKKIQIFYI